MVLFELGELNYRGVETVNGVDNSWPVEINIFIMAITNAAFFFFIKYAAQIFGYSQNDVRTFINSLMAVFNNNFQLPETTGAQQGEGGQSGFNLGTIMNMVGPLMGAGGGGGGGGGGGLMDMIGPLLGGLMQPTQQPAQNNQPTQQPPQNNQPARQPIRFDPVHEE